MFEGGADCGGPSQAGERTYACADDRSGDQYRNQGSNRSSQFRARNGASQRADAAADGLNGYVGAGMLFGHGTVVHGAPVRQAGNAGRDGCAA